MFFSEGSVYKSSDQGNYRTMPSFPGIRAASLLPADVSALLKRSPNCPHTTPQMEPKLPPNGPQTALKLPPKLPPNGLPYIGAYPL